MSETAPLKLINPVDSSDLTEAVKEYTIPATHAEDGVRVPVSPVVIVDPSSNPHRLVPQGWWLYQARRVATDANVAGNPMKIDISMNVGQIGRLIRLYASHVSVGNHAMYVFVRDEDAAQTSKYSSVALAAAGETNLPTIGTAATVTDNTATSENAMFGPGESLSIDMTGVSANANNTTTVAIALLLSTADIPIWSYARSVDVANITLAASTISDANTLQKVDLPW